MQGSNISRRKFVGSAALGAGVLALTPSASIFAAQSMPSAVTLKGVWKQSKEYMLEFAQAMPEDKYVFKPTEEVFSYAEQLLHLAGANYWFFSTLKGVKPPMSEDALKAEGKSGAEVKKLLEDSFTYGDEVVNGMDDASAAAEVTMGKNKLAAWKLLLFCADHITHHRGQTVVYLRLNGIKPPQYRSGYFG